MIGRANRLGLRLAPAATLAVVFALAAPITSSASLTTVGSPLSVPATLNTAENLSYAGTNTDVLPTPETPTGVVHTYHYGADTALWDTQLENDAAAMPESGQAVKIRLEGCAVPAPSGPPPLTQIHFQSLSPLPGGGAQVQLSSQSFSIPVCGQGGASGSTVSTYVPINLCVSRGGFVAFNEEGGFVEKAYQSGVRYQVLGAVAGSSLDSFIRGNGTGDGAVLSPLDVSNMDGFAFNRHEELMMQVVLGTGADARYVCPGGSRDAPKALAPMRISRQTDGINAQRIVSVAIYCRPAAGCNGTASMTLTRTGTATSVGHAPFSLPGNHTSHLALHVSQMLLNLIRKHHGAATTFTAVMGGQAFSQTVTVKIL